MDLQVGLVFRVQGLGFMVQMRIYGLGSQAPIWGFRV